jgi:hypothetical protein
VAKAFVEAVSSLASDARAVVQDWQEEMQYHFDKELAAWLSKHPELFAELRRAERRLRRSWDEATRNLGLR